MIPANNDDEVSPEQYKAQLAASLSEVLRLRNSIRFQLGNALIDALQSPLKLLSLPVTLRNIKRVYSRIRVFYQITGALECGLAEGLPTHDSALVYDDVKTAHMLATIVTRYKSTRQMSKRLKALKTQDPIIASFIKRALELDDIANSGLALPRKNKTPSYRANKKTVMYALHASRPLSSNGYAIRSHCVITALKTHDIDVIPTVRASKAPSAHQDDGGQFIVDDVVYARLDAGSDNATIESTLNAYATSIETAAQKYRPKILHAASNWTTGMAGLIAARRLGLPFIYEVRGFWEYTRCSVEKNYIHSLGFAAQVKLESQLVGAADHVFTLSEPMGTEILRRGAHPDLVSITPNGTDNSDGAKCAKGLPNNPRFSCPADVTVIGFVGSITAYEGLDHLMKATSDLLKKGLKLHFLIVGDGPAKAELVDKAVQLGITKHVTFTGALPPRDAKACYGKIDLAVFIRPDTVVTQLVEPLKPIEAMSMGCAVLLSPVKPFLTIAGADLQPDQQRAFVTKDWSHGALTDKLSEVLRSPDLRGSVACLGEKWVKEHRSWTQVTKKMVDIYEELSKPLPK